MRAVACICYDPDCPVHAVLIECPVPFAIRACSPLLCPACSEQLEELGHYELSNVRPVARLSGGRIHVKR